MHNFKFAGPVKALTRFSRGRVNVARSSHLVCHFPIKLVREPATIRRGLARE